MKERPLEGYTWSGRDLRGNNQSQDICGSICRLLQKKRAKQRWAIEKPKLDNAIKLRGIFFVEPNDEEFKLTVKAARRNASSALQIIDKEQW